MATRLTYPIFKAFSSAGALAANFKLWTYEAGTSTPLASYTDATGTTLNTNPVILNSLGEAAIYLSESAKLTLMDTSDAIQDGWPKDNIDPTTTTAEEVSFTPSGSVSGTTVQTALAETISTFSSRLDVEWVAVAVATTMASGRGYLLDTLTGTAAIIMTLPLAPTVGDKVYIADAGGSFNTYNCTVARNSSKILGLEEDLTLDVNKMAIGLIYQGSDYGWVAV